MKAPHAPGMARVKLGAPSFRLGSELLRRCRRGSDPGLGIPSRDESPGKETCLNSGFSFFSNEELASDLLEFQYRKSPLTLVFDTACCEKLQKGPEIPQRWMISRQGDPSVQIRSEKGASQGKRTLHTQKIGSPLARTSCRKSSDSLPVTGPTPPSTIGLPST